MLAIQSPAFAHHASIPQKYTCQGEDLSPPLRFSDIPDGTQSLVLIMDDPDAPRGTFDHWIVWNLLPQQNELKEGAFISALQGTNGFGERNYRGPCPPAGKPHRYFFKLYALDTILNLKEGESKGAVEKAMKGHVLEQAELIGTYQRS